MMRLILTFALILLSTALMAEEVPLKKIFNGQDLEGWQTSKKNIWWTVQDNILICKNGPKKKGSTLSTQKQYKNFVLELDFKFISGTIDSGIFIRNQDQIQVGISGSLKRDMTGSPYIPKKGYPKEAEGVKELLRLEDWNTIKVKAVGPKYSIWLNGQKVNEYTSATAISEGPIGLQLHAKRDMEIHFKNIKVAELK